MTAVQEELVTEDEVPVAKRPSRRWPLIGLIVLCLGLGGWFRWQATTLWDDPAAQNQALVDPSGTSQVASEIGDALGKVFSYRYDNTAQTEQAAKQVLAGDALGQYDKLFAEVRKQAPAQKLVLTTKAVLTGVSLLDGDRAQLLVFLDQSATRGDNNQSAVAPAQLTVTAQRQDGHWRITGLQPR
ncbi:hypothetical protein [Kutzneria albida]|uniref:Mce-associated membrane protein n=1 Tax=Kutzneria albida DSM 43870 TaxID=1449976 RepID=W5WG13_9PSEU|nr:hypothetical protein [Kutzneria albida]AHH99665.1 hypothetical protein KALB_6305 [Kutzneria albida DSM 43870]